MPVRLFIFFCCCVIGGLAGGCANVLPPSGGAKDTVAPRLLSINPADSGLRVFPKKITMRFDEYVTVADAAAQISISPLLAQNISADADLRTVTLTLPDTLLKPSTTYRIRLGKSVRDLHEDIPFRAFSYTFSTGDYFDSLTLAGRVVRAETGAPDTSAQVVLYEADAGDSSLLKQKPEYVTTVNATGQFQFSGLPARPFRVYALSDKNANLLFDKPDERVAFQSETVTPVVQDSGRILLRSFMEKDTSISPPPAADNNSQQPAASPPKPDGTYRVDVDTSNRKKRTLSLQKPLAVIFPNGIVRSINPARIFLTRDSNGVVVESPITARNKMGDSTTLELASSWQPNTLYTLRLLKGFVKDGEGRDAMPGKWIFRTRSDEDYAKLTINLPKEYRDSSHVLQVVRDDRDTIFQKTITVLSVLLPRLEPGTYTMRVIADRNRNGVWDAGNLIRKEQPERVFPLDRKVMLKAGWENIVDWKTDNE